MIFGNHYSNKSKFLIHKEPISIDKVKIKKIALSKIDLYDNKGSYKYYIEYITNVGITPLLIILPKMNACTKYCNSNSIYINFVINNQEVLKKYIKI